MAHVDDVELATLGLGPLVQHERLHGYLDDVPPSEFQAAYAAQQTDQLTGWNPITRVSIKPRTDHSRSRACSTPSKPGSPRPMPESSGTSRASRALCEDEISRRGTAALQRRLRAARF